jgi:hypothetical protein
VALEVQSPETGSKKNSGKDTELHKIWPQHACGNADTQVIFG